MLTVGKLNTQDTTANDRTDAVAPRAQVPEEQPMPRQWVTPTFERKSTLIQEDVMDKQETKVSNINTTTNQQPALRPWVTPTFERTTLKEALSSKSGHGTDGVGSYS